MIRMRAPTGVRFHFSKAACAERIARSISSAVANGTVASTSCVAGLITSRHSWVLDSTGLPSIRSITLGGVLDTVWGDAFMDQCRFLVDVVGAAAPNKTNSNYPKG